MLLFLAGCLQTGFVPTPCTPPAEAPVSDPDGVADAAALDAIARALVAFDTWTGDLPVCVSEVVLADRIEVEGHAVAGYFHPPDQSIHLAAYDDYPFEDVLFHELCHAADDRSDLSPPLADLLPEDPFLDPELYATEAARRREAFAEACGAGPPPAALLDALDTTCGDVDPLTLALREGVWQGWSEPALDVGPTVRFVPIGRGELGHGSVSDGVRVYTPTNGVRALGARGAGVVGWDPGAEDPRRYWLGDELPTLYPGLGAPPLAVVEEGGRVLALRPRGPAAFDADWLLELFQGRSFDLTRGADRAWFQVWGDGQPLQVRDLATGETHPQPGDTHTALAAPTFEDDGLPVALGWLDLPAPSGAWWLDDDGIAAFPSPKGLDGLVRLADGRLLGWAQRDDAEGATRFSWVVEDGAGGWGLSPTSCEAPEAWGPLAVAGGRLLGRGDAESFVEMTLDP